MCAELQTVSYFRFYPIPPLSGIVQNSMVYIGNDLYRKYYKAYSKPIDKSYYLNLFDKRMDNPPYKSEILGEDLGYLHNCLVDDTAAGLLYQTFLTRSTFDKTVEAHHTRFNHLTALSIFPSIMFAVIDLTSIPVNLPFFQFFEIPKYKIKHYIKYTAQQMLPGGFFVFIDNPWKRFAKITMKHIPNIDENYVKQKPYTPYRFMP